MASCTAHPLAASADIDPWPETPPGRPLPEWPHCCTRMATPFSRCYASCTGGEAVVLGVLAYVSAELTFGASCVPCTCACALYFVLHMVQRTHTVAGLQVLQGTLGIALAIVGASHPSSALALWFAMAAAIAHLFFAVVLYELMRLGDCRACLQEAHACECGRDKDPLPPGALHALQISLARKFRLHRS